VRSFRTCRVQLERGASFFVLLPATSIKNAGGVRAVTSNNTTTTTAEE
jgi:hypothetical protein